MPASTTKLDFRLSTEAKQTLTPAAQAVDRPASQFILESTLSGTEETLADRRHFALDVEPWAALMSALDAPPRNMPRLQRLLNEKGPFDHH